MTDVTLTEVEVIKGELAFSKGDKGDKGDAYVITDADKQEIKEALSADISELKSDLVKETDKLSDEIGRLRVEYAHGGYGYVDANTLRILGSSATTYFYTQPILLERGFMYYFKVKGYSTISVLTKADSTGKLESMLVKGIETEEQKFDYIPEQDMYVVVSCSSDYPMSITKKSISDGIDVPFEFGGYGYYDKWMDVKASEAQTYSYTKPIPLKKGHKYAVNVVSWSAVCAILECDANGVPIQVITMGEPHEENYTYYHIPQSDKYVVVSYKSGWPLIVKDFPLPQNYTKWVAIGDSLTHKNYRAYNNYTDFVANDLEIECTNLGHSGWNYSNFYDIVNNKMPKDFDIVSIFGSGNFITALPMGDVSDNGTDTILGNVNRTIDLYLSKYPTIPLVIITPTPWAEHCNGTLSGSVMETYSNALIEICKAKSIPYLDLYHGSGLRPWDASVQAAFYTEEGVEDPGCHPNTQAHKHYIAPKVREFFKTIIY